MTAQRQAVDRVKQIGPEPNRSIAVRSNANNTQRNQIGPLGHGPTVTVFHQKSAKLTSGCWRSEIA